MVVIGDVVTPYTLAEPELLGPLPFGDLVTPFTLESVPRASNSITNRFPVPPVAWAFLTLVDAELALDSVKTVLAGAVFPESTNLEPTIGQIWPR